MTHKKIAILFLELAGFGRVDEAFDKFTTVDFIHHNQYFKGDRLSLKQAMAQAHLSSPNKKVDVRHVYLDGDTVITHSHVVKDNMEIAVVHIFRFQGGKIAELWDLGQVIDPKSPNQHGLF